MGQVYEVAQKVNSSLSVENRSGGNDDDRCWFKRPRKNVWKPSKLTSRGRKASPVFFVEKLAFRPAL
jgi:hypothetical protein